MTGPLKILKKKKVRGDREVLRNKEFRKASPVKLCTKDNTEKTTRAANASTALFVETGRRKPQGRIRLESIREN